MQKNLFIILLVIISFSLGYAYKSEINSNNNSKIKVTGIGGIFFKSKDPKNLKLWYSKNLGLDINSYGAKFEWREGIDSSKYGVTQWTPFSDKTKYFEPSTKDFMVNYRVGDLVLLLAELKSNNVNILDTIETYDYGKFVHILDIEGNKIELWQPTESDYNKSAKNKSN